MNDASAGRAIDEVQFSPGSTPAAEVYRGSRGHLEAAPPGRPHAVKSRIAPGLPHFLAALSLQALRVLRQCVKNPSPAVVCHGGAEQTCEPALDFGPAIHIAVAIKINAGKPCTAQRLDFFGQR